jgi:penicillin-binding protein-related factor A (putative recombinase)
MCTTIKKRGIFLVSHINKEVYYFESKLIELAKTRFKPVGFLKLTVGKSQEASNHVAREKEILPLLSLVCKHVATE